MPTSYLEALTELQQSGVAALKVAHTTHVTSLRMTSEWMRTLEGMRALFAVPPVLSNAANLATTFTLAMLEQQVAYTKQLADALTPPLSAAPHSAATPPPLVGIVTAPTETPIAVQRAAPVAPAPTLAETKIAEIEIAEQPVIDILRADILAATRAMPGSETSAHARKKSQG